MAPGEAENYQINEVVDYYRPPTNKDIPGWTGPARIVDLTQIHRRTVGINHQGRSITCKPGALRRHLSFLCFESAMLSTTAKALVERLVDRSVIDFGLVKLAKPDGSTYWQNIAVTNHRGNGFAKLQQFAIQCFNIDGCVAIRVAKGVGSLPALVGYSTSLFLWWHPREPGSISTYEYDCSESLSMRHYLPEKWIETRIIQMLRSSDYNPSTRPLNEPEQTVDNANADQRQQVINHDLPGRVDDANNRIHATSSPSNSGLLTPIPEESTQPSTSELDETDQFFTHEEPDLRHTVHAACLAVSKKAYYLANQNHLIEAKTCLQVPIFQPWKNYLPTLKRPCFTIMLLLLIYKLVLTPIMGPMTNPSMLKPTIKETQRNSYITDPVRQRKAKYWHNACISLERAELLSKETMTHSLPKNSNCTHKKWQPQCSLNSQLGLAKSVSVVAIVRWLGTSLTVGGPSSGSRKLLR